MSLSQRYGKAWKLGSLEARELHARDMSVGTRLPGFHASKLQGLSVTTVLTPRSSNNPYNVIIIMNHDRVAG
jgi:hypothetical protein